MNAVSPNPKPASTATFQIALWLLGTVLAGQFAAASWAVFGPDKNGRFALRSGGASPMVDLHTEVEELPAVSEIPAGGTLENYDPDFSDGGLPGLPNAPSGTNRDLAYSNPDAGTSAKPPPLRPGGSRDTIPRELGGTARSPKSNYPPISLSGGSGNLGESEEPFFIVPPEARLVRPEVIGTVAAGVKMRSEGDTLGALESLRKADGMRPDNPKILHEMATTYHYMGQLDKAHALWERVLAMGDAGAGDYFALAEMELETADVKPKGEPLISEQGTIRIGEVTATRDPNRSDGEQIRIRIPIHSAEGVQIQPLRVAAYIYFFDLVEGTRIEQTTRRTEIAQNWVSAPIDWATSDPEYLDVTYFLRPVDTEPGAISPRQRRYHGYVIRLFYEDALQDIVANPRTLLDLKIGGQDDNPQLDDSLFGGS